MGLTKVEDTAMIAIAPPTGQVLPRVQFIPGSFWTRERALRAARAATRTYEAGCRRLEAWVAGYTGSHAPVPPADAPALASPGRAVVRRGNPRDVPGIERLLNATDLPPFFVAEFIQGFVVAETAGEIIGAGGLEPYGRAGILRSVAVSPRARGLGLGRLIAELLIEDARESGLRDLYLSASDAAGYWESFGFGDKPLADWHPATERAWQYRFFREHREFAEGIGLRTMWRPV